MPGIPKKLTPAQLLADAQLREESWILLGKIVEAHKLNNTDLLVFSHYKAYKPEETIPIAIANGKSQTTIEISAAEFCQAMAMVRGYANCEYLDEKGQEMVNSCLFGQKTRAGLSKEKYDAGINKVLSFNSILSGEAALRTTVSEKPTQAAQVGPVTNPASSTSVSTGGNSSKPMPAGNSNVIPVRGETAKPAQKDAKPSEKGMPTGYITPNDLSKDARFATLIAGNSSTANTSGEHSKVNLELAPDKMEEVKKLSEAWHAPDQWKQFENPDQDRPAQPSTKSLREALSKKSTSPDVG